MAVLRWGKTFPAVAFDNHNAEPCQRTSLNTFIKP
jgi:hypothetical protein